MSRTVFERVIDGELPSRKVYENETVVAFLDIDQSDEGHLLVVPRIAVDKFYELEDEVWSELMRVSKELAVRLERVTGCRTRMEILGVDVPHVHVHLVPITVVSGKVFGENKLAGLSADEIWEALK